MKASPFLRSKWPKNWMVQQFYSGSEPLLSIGQRRIHGDQRVIEGAQRLQTHVVLRCGLLRRHTSRRQKPESCHIERTDAIAQRGPATERLADLHGLQRSLGRCSVAEKQVLEDLGTAPLPRRNMMPVGLRHFAR